MRYEIRQAGQNDLQTVLTITHETIRAVYPHYYPAGAVAFFLCHHNPAAVERDIAENLVYLCISADGQAVGTVTVKENDIGRLFVLPEYQGHGYGGALLRYAEQLIGEQYDEAVLGASFAAKAIYLRHGWQETGSRLSRAKTEIICAMIRCGNSCACRSMRTEGQYDT